MRRFAKGENKEEIARPLIEAAEREGGDGRVVLIGIAQEKTPMWRSWKAKGQEHVAHPHMEWGRQMGFVNHFYFYLWDPDWGGAFWKTNAYAPWPVWIWLNGHTWAQRQCERLGIGYTALDNGFRDCEDPAALQRICDRLGSGAVKSFFWRWQRRLPSPLTRADVRAGYVYELAFRQFEVSDTRVFDRPAAGRSFFEQLIRDHLDVGPPGVGVADLRPADQPYAPRARLRTKVITKGVDPQISCYYKSSRIKQYFKEHRALRTETVICNTRDFGIGRRVTAENWKALRAVGDAANQRLCDAQAADARPAPDVATFTEVTRPSHDRRPARPRTALRGATGDGGDGRHRRVHPPARRVRQPHPGPARRRPARSALHQPPGDLRPASAQTQGPHRSAIGTSPLPTHPTGQTRRRPVHQGLRTGPGARPCRP